MSNKAPKRRAKAALCADRTPPPTGLSSGPRAQPVGVGEEDYRGADVVKALERVDLLYGFPRAFLV